MDAIARPRVVCESLHPTLIVTDIGEAIDFYTTKLGFDPGFTWGDPPDFAGVDLGSMRIFLARGTPQSPEGGLSFVVADVEELYEFHRAGGVSILHEPGDREWGMREYAVVDPYGHRLSFGQHSYRVGPPIEIERVDEPGRLERRLAGLLADLAEHKRMSVSECLEEILLHTCEPWGDDGVASPHTRGTLRHIEDLKRRHGIDYDTHASYRFVEKPR